MTCGVQFAPSSSPPTRCDVCEDERQYVGWSGQQWGTLEDLQRDHINEIREDFGLTGIGTKPSFAISDYWKRIGVTADVDVVPVQLQNDKKYRAEFPGLSLQGSTSGIPKIGELTSGHDIGNSRRCWCHDQSD